MAPVEINVTEAASAVPVVNAEVTLMSTPNDKVHGFTDTAGHLTLTPQNPVTQIVVRADGFVPVRRYTNGKQVAGEHNELTFALEKGVRIGGRVVDENGAPLPNAKNLFEAAKEYPGLDQTMDTVQRTALTGIDGTWQYDGLPDDV